MSKHCPCESCIYYETDSCPDCDFGHPMLDEVEVLREIDRWFWLGKHIPRPVDEFTCEKLAKAICQLQKKKKGNLGGIR